MQYGISFFSIYVTQIVVYISFPGNQIHTQETMISLPKLKLRLSFNYSSMPDNNYFKQIFP